MISGVASTPRYASPLALAAVRGGGGTPPAPVLAPSVPATSGSSTAPATPAPTPPASGGSGGVFSALAGFFGGIVHAIGSFFSHLFGHGSTPGTGSLTADQQALATKYGLLPTVDNVNAFQAEQLSYQQQGVLGPGSPNSGAVTQLQQALVRLGYASVAASGQYDAATQAAVVQFKKDQSLHQTYKLADGSWAVNEWLDPTTYSAMKAKLASLPASGSTGSTGAGSGSGVTATIDWQTVASENGLLSSQANVNAYVSEFNGYASTNALTPASTDSASITQLQQALAKLGYAVSATGQYDSATQAAVVKFKQDNGLHQSYQLASGSYAVNAVADTQTLQLIATKVG